MKNWMKVAGFVAGTVLTLAEEYQKQQRAKEGDSKPSGNSGGSATSHKRSASEREHQEWGSGRSGKPDDTQQSNAGPNDVNITELLSGLAEIASDYARNKKLRQSGRTQTDRDERARRNYAATHSSSTTTTNSTPSPREPLPEGITEEDVAKYYVQPKPYEFNSPGREAIAARVNAEREAAARKRAIERAVAAQGPIERTVPKAPVWDYEAMRASHEKPAVALVRAYPPHREAHGRSHFGGLPDLPVGIAWPRTAEGIALHFMMQVDLAELPWRPEGVPAFGTLFFFAYMDETLIVDDWDYQGQLVLFDPTSSGQPTSPPDDIEALDDRQVTNKDLSSLATGVLPHWPLKPVQITTMPHAEAIEGNSYHKPELHDYIRSYLRHRAEEIEAKTGLAAISKSYHPKADVYEAPTSNPNNHAGKSKHASLRLKSYDDPSGPPWLWHLVGLFSRLMLKSTLKIIKRPAIAPIETFQVANKAHQEALEWSRLSSDHQGHEKLDEASANAFSQFVFQCGENGFAAPNSFDQCIRQLVEDSGGDRHLASGIPDVIYDLFYPLHAPITGADGAENWDIDDHQDIHYSQMFGYASMVQWVWPIQSSDELLLQIESDGLLTIGDCGELTYSISKKALAKGNLEATQIMHTGC